jgi:flavodoxin
MVLHKLVVYYSLEGSTRFMAEEIAKDIQADIMELKPKKPYSKKGLRMAHAALGALLKKKAELEPIDKHVEDYEAILIGTPIWAGNISPPVRTFLTHHHLHGKKIGLFASCGGQTGLTFKDMKKNLAGNEIIGEIILTEASKNPEENTKKIREWVTEIYHHL